MLCFVVLVHFWSLQNYEMKTYINYGKAVLLNGKKHFPKVDLGDKYGQSIIYI